jgi:phosphoribosylamine--glycine ligase
MDPGAIVDVARARAVELVVVGPESWLAAGVVDALTDAGIPVFGPTAAAALIETSKAFCHEVAEAAGVPMAHAIFATSVPEVEAAVREISAAGNGFVVKADGLAAGKGVTVHGPDDNPGAWKDAIDGFDGKLGGPVLVEERLFGPEASVIAICDGTTAIALPAARDHKRLRDGDRGPNTGGMGAYSPLPDLDEAAVEDILGTIHRPILAELARRGAPFRGFLYAGLMLTVDGPRLLECNARLGDPEAQAILPRVAVPLGPILLAAARGRLDRAGARSVPSLPDAAVAIVLAGGGYPLIAQRGATIQGLDGLVGGSLVFHSGTRRANDGSWTVDGGRILSVVGRGPDLEAARAVAERDADRIEWPGMQRRHDIGLVTTPQPEATSQPIGAAR